MTGYKFKDTLDMRIYKIACEHPGIRLAVLAGGVGVNMATVRYRVFDLEREGVLTVEKGRNSVKVYPTLHTDGSTAGDQ